MKLFGKILLTLAVCIALGNAISGSAHIMEPVPAHYPYGYAVPYQVMPYAPYPIGHMPYPYAHLYAYSIPDSRFTTVDFDVNTVADERLLRTFPLSIGARNYLEIKFRAAYNLYRQGKFQEALEAFSDESVFRRNYLFLYWAGMSAVRLGNQTRAAEFFNRVLAINPSYEPARREVTLIRQ